MSELIHEVEFRAAWDKTDPDPKKNYGKSPVEIFWCVKGPAGVIQFRLMTGWGLETIAPPDSDWSTLGLSLNRWKDDRLQKLLTLPVDLGYHSPIPMYEGQSVMRPCHFFEQGFCYYDGSSLNADRPFSILVHQGGVKLWEFLDNYYISTFSAESDEVKQ